MAAIWRAILVAGVIAGAVSCRRSPAPVDAPHYNVVLISVDTLRADRLNCYGYRDRIVSPNIDALARDGILFEQLITASPWTTPAHLSMLTSLNPSTHGVTASFQDLTRDLLFGGRYYKLPEAKTALAEVLRDNGLVTAAFTAGVTVDPKIGFGQGFGLYDTSMYKLSGESMEAMYDWVRRNRHNKFFLFWHTFEVHAPYLHTDFISDVLSGESAANLRKDVAHLAAILTNENPSGPGRLRYHKQFVSVLRRHGAFNLDVTEALYLGGVRSIDRWLGQFIRLLRDQHLYDQTLIIFTSDHGEEFADRSLQNIYDRHGHTLYEELVRVPLIIKLPYQRFAGRRVADVSRMIDIMPTILDILSIAPARDEMQGASLRPLWEQAGSAPQRVAYTEALAGELEMKSVRTRRYKYVISIGPETVAEHGRSYVPDQPLRRELYDLWQDPKERDNLLASPRGPAIDELASSFDRRLRQFVSEQAGAPEEVTLDEETIERLRALGYIK